MAVPKKATLAQVRRYAKKLGATIEVDIVADEMTIYADAPDGRVWRATGGTVLVAATRTDYIGWAAEARGALLDEMKDGLR